MDFSKHPQYIESFQRADSIEEIHAVCGELAGDLGFGGFLYGARLPTSLADAATIIITSYPEGWRERYEEKRYIHVDPTITHTHNNVTPLTWDRISYSGKNGEKIRQFMNEATEFGLHAGATLPVHSGQGEAAMLNVFSDSSSNKEQQRILSSLPHLQMLATYAHESVRRIIEIREIAPAAPVLTTRERECLLWTAEGKTSWEIGQILGISERTVIFHLQNAGDKLNVSNRRHAVARAISMGLLAPHIA